MVLGTVKRALAWATAALFAGQVATVGALIVVDQRRKRQHLPGRFPSAPPREMRAGEDYVTIYTKGRDLYDDMLAAIEGARERVLLETYIWKSDRVGVRFKQALEDAAARGVDVHVVYDVFGNLVVPQSFFRFADGIHVLRHKPWTGMRRLAVRLPGLNHRKLLVVDSDSAFIGGYNIGSLYATHWRDTHMRVRGPAVADIQNAFVDYWNSTRHRHLPELAQPRDRPWSSAIHVTRNVPSTAVYPIRYMYLEAIDRARERIWLTHAYLIPDDDLTLALLEAADRGVDVRIVVPAESNHILADWLSRGFYRLLLSHGVRLLLYQDAMVHAKTAVVDSVWSTIGTANLDRLSLVGNYEINADVLDADVAAEMERIFAMDADNCVELTLDEWVRRPVVARAAELILTPLRPLL